MKTRTPLAALLGSALAFACQGEPDPSLPEISDDDSNGDEGDGPPEGSYQSPAGDGFMFAGAGGFVFTGPTAPGTASATQAPVVDWDNFNQPPALGGGSFDIELDGVSYTAVAAESMAGVMPGYAGSDYLVLSVYEILPPQGGVEVGQVVHVIVPASEAVPGASIALDGQERVALFAYGDISQPEPSVAGAAVTGTVTVTAAGAQVGDLVTLDVDADFGPIDWSSLGGGGGGGGGRGGGGGGGGGGNLVAGNYALTFGPVDVYCDGDLAGQESAFASVNLGYQSGTVSLADLGGGTWELSGAAATASFGGAVTLGDLGPDAPPGMVGAEIGSSLTGPMGTTAFSQMVYVDGGSASATSAYGGAGVAFMNGAQTGFCGVQMYFDLSAAP